MLFPGINLNGTGLMVIRKASKKDWRAIIEIYNQAVDERYCTADIDHVTIDSRTTWLEEHNNQRYPLYVCELNGLVRGWSSLSPYRPGRRALSTVAEISYYVHKDARRKNVGVTLLDQCLKEAKELGFLNIIALVLEPNRASMKLLNRFGFQVWGFMPRLAVFDGETCGQYIFGLNISEPTVMSTTENK
jgi:phosphinothricin acetyltransferase